MKIIKTSSFLKKKAVDWSMGDLPVGVKDTDPYFYSPDPVEGQLMVLLEEEGNCLVKYEIIDGNVHVQEIKTQNEEFLSPTDLSRNNQITLHEILLQDATDKGLLSSHDDFDGLHRAGFRVRRHNGRNRFSDNFHRRRQPAPCYGVGVCGRAGFICRAYGSRLQAGAIISVPRSLVQPSWNRLPDNPELPRFR